MASYSYAAQAIEDTAAPVTRGFVNGVQIPDGGDAPWEGGGWEYPGSTLTLEATDAASAVATTYVSVAGRAWTTYQGAIKVLGEGLKPILYYSVDAAGNVEATRTLTIRLDNTDPWTPAYVNGVRVWDGTTAPWMGTGPVVLTLTPGDDRSGVAATFVSMDGSTWQPYHDPVPVTAEGIRTLRFYTVDVAGNVEVTRTATVRVDRTAPVTVASINGAVVADGATMPWIRDGADLALYASDSGGGVVAVQYSFDGVTWETYGPYTAFLSGLGTHQIWYRSIDIAGNAEAPRSMTVRMDGTGPTTYAYVNEALMPDGAVTPWIGPPGATLTFTAQDPETGVAGISYSLPNFGWPTYTDRPPSPTACGQSPTWPPTTWA